MRNVTDCLRGFPKGPQPLGTLTLLARSSVLYLDSRGWRGTPLPHPLAALLSCLLIPAAKEYPSLFPLRFSVNVSRTRSAWNRKIS